MNIYESIQNNLKSINESLDKYLISRLNDEGLSGNAFYDWLEEVCDKYNVHYKDYFYEGYSVIFRNENESWSLTFNDSDPNYLTWSLSKNNGEEVLAEDKYLGEI